MYYERKVSKVGVQFMKPRIFVSSTFYDLKYIREDLSNFIKAHDFEPIMFEDGDIGYTPGCNLDKSCYDTMRTADMVILIIGGNYGSPASGEEIDGFKEYLSVTRREFQNAVNHGIPIYVFIDSKVYTEYEIYEENQKTIEDEKSVINFRNVKNINVFRFIKEIKSVGNIPITEFNKIIQIKEFLSKQWADMFKKYLELLKENKTDEKIKESVNEMHTIVQKMNVMLDSVGRKILSDDSSHEYSNVVEKQEIIEAANTLSSNISFYADDCYVTENTIKRREIIENILNTLERVINGELGKEFKRIKSDNVGQFFSFFANNNLIINSVSAYFMDIITSIKAILENPRKKSLLISALIQNNFYYKILENKENETICDEEVE